MASSARSVLASTRAPIIRYIFLPSGDEDWARGLRLFSRLRLRLRGWSVLRRAGLRERERRGGDERECCNNGPWAQCDLAGHETRLYAETVV